MWSLGGGVRQHLAKYPIALLVMGVSPIAQLVIWLPPIAQLGEFLFWV
jgi:hypothetical protein